MRKFQNLSNKECLEVYPKVYANSKTLFKTGSLAANEGNYGVASSLTILATEETLKALVIFCNGMGISVFQQKEFKGFFTQHKNRHELAKMIGFINVIESILSIIKGKAIGLLSSPNRNWFNRFKFTLKRILYLLETSKEIQMSIEKNQETSDWWSNADNLKNRGLYVDYSNGLISPVTISKSEYLATKRMYINLKKRYIVTCSFLEVSESRPEWAIVKEINDSLLLYQRGKLW